MGAAWGDAAGQACPAVDLFQPHPSKCSDGEAPMNTHKAAYWLALAVLGFAFHSEYRHGAFPTLHRAANCAEATFCKVATHARQTVIMAKMLTDRPALTGDNLVADDLKTDGLVATVDAKEMVAEMGEDRAEWLRDQAQSQIEQHRDQLQDRAELLRDQARARAAMIRAMVEAQRVQLNQARLRARTEALVSNAVHRQMIVVRSSGCSDANRRNAITSSLDSQDEDEDIF